MLAVVWNKGEQIPVLLHVILVTKRDVSRSVPELWLPLQHTDIFTSLDKLKLDNFCKRCERFDKLKIDKF